MIKTSELVFFIVTENLTRMRFDDEIKQKIRTAFENALRNLQ